MRSIDAYRVRPLTPDEFGAMGGAAGVWALAGREGEHDSQFVPDDIDELTRIIVLTNGYYALIEAADAGRISGYLWYSLKIKQKNGREHCYARAYLGCTRVNGKKKERCEYLHRFLMGPTAVGEVVDHKFGFTLDCRRRNLEVTTPSGNMTNLHTHRRIQELEARVEELEAEGRQMRDILDGLGVPYVL